MIDIPFLKKLGLPKFELDFGFGPHGYAGIDIGSESVKVVELEKKSERAVLKTYGELKTGRYFERAASLGAGGFLGYPDKSVIELLTDVFKEANVKTDRAVFAIPSASSFITTIGLPLLKSEELKNAVPFEAKKYIPIPSNEVAMDWQVISESRETGRISVLIVAVPLEVIEKFRRISEAMRLKLEGVEVESFSLVRALAMGDPGVTAIINFGALVTTLTVADQGRMRLNHNFGHGSSEITKTLAQSLAVSPERAEATKREAGLSDRPEEREIREIIAPMVDRMLADAERAMLAYNRGADRKIERIVLAGGGGGMPGLAGYVAERFGLETSLANGFLRTVFPPFLAPMLKEIAPNFSVAVGLALRQIMAG